MQLNAPQPAVEGASAEQSHNRTAAAVTPGTKPGPGPRRVVEVDARKLYTEDSALIGLGVEVFWAKEQQWYRGKVTADAEEHHYPALQILYSDGDCEDVVFTQNFTKVLVKERDAEATSIRFLDCKPVWAAGSSTPLAAEAAAAYQPSSRARKRSLPRDSDNEYSDPQNGYSSGEEYAGAAADGKPKARSYGRLEGIKRRNLGAGQKDLAAGGIAKKQSRGLKRLDGTLAGGSAANSAGELSQDHSSADDSETSAGQRQKLSAAKAGVAAVDGTGKKRGRPPKAAATAGAAAAGASKPRGSSAGPGASRQQSPAPVRQPSPAQQQQQQQQQAASKPSQPQQQQQQQAAIKQRPQPTAEQLKAAMKKAAAAAQQSQAARPKTVILDDRPQGATAAGSNPLIKRVSSSGAVAGKSPAAIAGKSTGAGLTSPTGNRSAAAADSSDDAAAAAKAAALQALLGGAATAAGKPRGAVTSMARPRPHHQAIQQQIQQHKEQQQQQKAQQQQQQQQDKQSKQQQQTVAAAQKPAGNAAAALAAALAGNSAGGSGGSGKGPSSAEIAAGLARRRAAEQTWIATLAAMPVSGKGIKEVGSKALEMCSTIGPQKVVTAVIDQMGRLPFGPGRVNLLYLIDSTLKQAQKLPSAQMNKFIADLPNKVSAGLTQLVAIAVYDLESLRKVKHLLDLWCQNGRIVASYAKLAYQQVAAFERNATAAQRAAAEAAALGIPNGLRVERVVLAAHESLDEEANAAAAATAAAAAAAEEAGNAPSASATATANGGPPTTTAAAAAAAARDPRSRQQQSEQQQQQQDVDSDFLEMYGEAPGSPSEAMLAALNDEVETDQQQEQQQDGGSSSSRAIKLYPRYKNLFGPATVAGYVLNQYGSIHELTQLPFAAAVNQLAAEHKGSAIKQRNTSGRGFVLNLQLKGLQLQLAPSILADRDYASDFVAETLADKRIGTWKLLLQPLDQAREADQAAAAAAGSDSQQQQTGQTGAGQEQEQQDGVDQQWDEGATVSGGRSASFDSSSLGLICPAAPKREEAADYSSYNNAATVPGGMVGEWGGFATTAAAGGAGFSFGQPMSQGLGITSNVTTNITPVGLGGQLSLNTVSSMGALGGLDAAMLAAQRQQMVQAAVNAALGLGMVTPASLGQQQQQQGWQQQAAAAAAAPAWASQLDDMMQQQIEEDDAMPPLPPEPEPPAEPAAAAAAGQEQQQQAPRKFVVPGAPDDDDDESDDFNRGPRRASAFMATDDDDDFGFAPPLPEGPPPEPSPEQPPLPAELPPMPLDYPANLLGYTGQETSPNYDPDEDDGQLPPLPAEEPPFAAGVRLSYGAGVTGNNTWQGQGMGVNQAAYDMDVSTGEEMFGSEPYYGKLQAGMAQGSFGMGMGMQAPAAMAVGAQGSIQQQQYMQQQRQPWQQQQQLMMGTQGGMGMGMQGAAAGQYGMQGQQQYWPQQQQQGRQPGMYQQQQY